MNDKTLPKPAVPTITVDIDGESIQIQPFRFGQFKQVFEQLGPVLGTLLSKREISVLSLAVEAPGPVIGLCMLATGKPREWFDQIGADDGLRIAFAVAEVNSDFFVQRVMPAASDGSPLAKRAFGWLLSMFARKAYEPRQERTPAPDGAAP